MSGAGWLAALVAAPATTALVLALLLALVGRGLESLFRWAALGVSSAAFAVALALFVSFDPTDTGFQFVTHVPWLPSFGANLFFGLDGIGLLLILLTAFVFPLIFLAVFRSHARDPRYVFAMLVLETGLLGSFASLNLLPLQLFNWMAWAPAAALIGGLGIGPRAERIAAANRLLLSAFTASLLILLATLGLGSLHADQMGFPSLDLVAVPGGGLPSLLDVRIDVPLDVRAGDDAPFWQQPLWLFVAFALGFAIQGPMLPLHVWLPAADRSAPSGVDALLGGVLAKLGIYGFLRVALPLFPGVSAEAAGWIAGLAVVGMLYAGVLGLLRRDLKGIVSSLSIVHLGVVMLGIASLGLEGIEGSVLHLLSHGLAWTGLFLLIGMLAERRGWQELSEFGGIARPMPAFATLLGLVAFAAMGLPPLSGFAGQLLVLLASFGPWPGLTLLATLSIGIGAVALLWGTRRVLFGPVENPANRGLIDLDRRERAVGLAVLVPIFWIGLHPATFLQRLEPSVGELRRVMEQRLALPEPEGVARVAQTVARARVLDDEAQP